METEDIMNEIDYATSPDNMSKRDAVDFMKSIISDLQVKIECLEMEIEDEGFDEIDGE